MKILIVLNRFMLYYLVSFTSISCDFRSSRGDEFIDSIAISYVRIVNEMGHYIADYVDFYFGPDSLSTPVPTNLQKDDPPFDELLVLSDSLLTNLENYDVGQLGKNNKLRYKFLLSHLKAVKTKLEIELGKAYPYAVEYQNLFNSEVPIFSDSYLSSLITELENALKGEGDLLDRYYNFLRQFSIPSEKLEEVYKKTLNEAKKRTAEHIDLFPNDSCGLVFVSNKPWDAYNSYVKNGVSVVKVNTDYSKSIKSAGDIGCHEAYPGHHVHSSLWEKELYLDNGWVEFSIGALYTPSYLIYEGIAEYAKDVAFPENEWSKFEREVLFPIVGLDTSKVDMYNHLIDLYKTIQWGSIIEGSKRYLDGIYTKNEAINYFVKYSLKSPSEAENMLPIIEYYRTYLVNYLNGKQLIMEFVEKRYDHQKNPAKRWELIQYIMSSPVLPSDLR